MYNFISLSDDEKRIIFENTASKMGLNSSIIEKDFWVCLVIDYLFNKCKYKNSFAFKGGTCLSKVYGLIDRFSEDIDIILDWRLLGYKNNEPWEERTNSMQEEFNREAICRQNEFLKNELLPMLKVALEDFIGTKINLSIDSDGTIKIYYPRTSDDKSILQEIRLEIGALAAWTPTTIAKIHPYINDCYPDLLKYSAVKLLATTDVRSFWEKATILHHEANRPVSSNLPQRYSRHYYDLYCMANKGLLESALRSEDLLIKVANFKNKFYPRKWAEYDKARMGTLKLYPSSHHIDELRKDYTAMKSMIYGKYPKFETLMEEIRILEKKINSNKKGT